MSRYLVNCLDCSFEDLNEEDDPPRYADPEQNPHLRPDHEWDAWSAALGAHDNHEMDTGHDVEIIDLDSGGRVGPGAN